MIDLITVLDAIRPLSAALREALSEKTRNISVGRYKSLPKPRHGNSIAVVASGIVRLFCEQDNGEPTLGFFCEGEVFVREPINNNSSQKFVYQALEPVTLHYLEAIDIVELSDRFAFGEYIQVLMSRYFEQLQRQNQLLNIHPATERYHHLLKHYNHLIQRVPVKYLAAYIGISRETLSRIRKKIIR